MARSGKRRAAAAALLLLSLPPALSFIAPSPLHRCGGLAASRSPSAGPRASLPSLFLLRAQRQGGDARQAEKGRGVQPRNGKAATLEPPGTDTPGAVAGGAAGGGQPGGPASHGQSNKLGELRGSEALGGADGGLGRGGGREIQPRLYPDPAASAVFLAALGASAYAASGGMPEATGALTALLSELSGGVPFSQSLLGLFAIGSASAIVAEAIAFPFDTIKTRIQLSSEGGGAHKGPKGKNLEGFAQFYSLYYGVGISLFRHIPYSGTRQMLYHWAKSLAEAGQPAGASLPFFALAGMAVTAGAVGQLVANPTDVLKVRMQSDGKKVNLGESPEYRGLADAVRRVWGEEGLQGMWVGSVPNAVRAMFMNLGDIAIYDTAKAFAEPYAGAGLGAAVFASAVCGLATAVLASPSEVARNRMMANGPTSPTPLYDNLGDCVVKTYREGGVAAFFQGILPFYARNGPWHLAFWLTFESLSSLADSVVPHL
uniref:ADP,ATP carrier protein n=1 Tax=Hemiselmis tepida TaxID=464990 RepID=A0A7S0VTG6_9CRYP|mmetsp:Transcript_22551/g.56948  ORF Transcript_22551/g.56948 Transcript_22551/m.56948 type:complete len:486 (+) Transcript_22551:183-1640(+)